VLSAIAAPPEISAGLSRLSSALIVSMDTEDVAASKIFHRAAKMVEGAVFPEI
jgi:hypothetical protein